MIEAFEKLSLTSSQYYTQLSTSQFSQRLIDCPPIKRLDSIVITNFKSFKNTVYTGPFLDFTSIVGPNGAGKSNILDALMFCFCNERNKVSYYDIRQFIHREGDQTYNEMMAKSKYCQVQVNFILSNGKTFSIKRTLYPNQTQQFNIDGDDYPQKIYEHFLMKCNINYINSNNAIWQGEIDKLLMKSPKELTSYIQNISGSIFFKKDQEQLEKELEDVDNKMQSKSVKLVKLKQERKHLKKLNNSKGNSLKIQAQYQNVLKKIAMIRIYLSELELKDLEKSIQLKQKEERDKIKELNENKAKIQKEQIEKNQLQQQMTKLMKLIAENNTLIKRIDQNTNVFDIQAQGQLHNEIDNLKQYAENLQRKREEFAAKTAGIQSGELNKQYLDLYSKWEKDNEAMNKELHKKKQQYLYIEGILQTKNTIVQQVKQKKQKIEKIKLQQHKQKAQIEANIEELNKTIARMKIQHSRNSQDYLKHRQKMNKYQDQLSQKNEKIIQLESLQSDSIQNQKDKELVHKLSKIQGFKGLMEQWIKPATKKYELCFQLMMSSILKYLLCVDENSSKQIAAKLKENGQLRTLVILENVQEKKQQISRAALGKLGIPAIESVDFDKNILKLDTFLKQFLNNKIICENLETAWKLLEQKIHGIKQIYTLDGNVLKGDGIVCSFGSIDTLKHKYKYSKNSSLILEEIKKLENEKLKLEEEISSCKKRQENDNKQQLEISKLIFRKEQLSSKLTSVKATIETKKEIKTPKGLDKEIDDLKLRSSKIEESIKEIQRQMLNSKIFSDFIKKNKIDGLDSFRSLQDLSSLQSSMKIRNRLHKQIKQNQREISRTQLVLQQKQQRFDKIDQKIKRAEGFQSKENILKTIKRQQEQLSEIRHRFTKMNNINPETLKFKSQTPQMLAKLSLMKERHEKTAHAQLTAINLTELPNPRQYQSLSEDLGCTLQRASKKRIQQANQKLQVEKQDYEIEIQKYNIDISNFNQSAQNQDNVDQQIQQITEQLKNITDKKNDLLEKLSVVRRDRKTIFVHFIQDLKPILKKSYEILTLNHDGVAGNIELYFEDEEFPCDEGLYFYPTPPAKRFVYDSDQLSGGEKSIASLALQYSISIASKSRFLVLDEIDAFLDVSNVKRFINLIQHSIEKNSLQFILITHKKGVFLNGKSLVGVSKPLSDPFSHAYSLILEEQDMQIYE